MGECEKMSEPIHIYDAIAINESSEWKFPFNLSFSSRINDRRAQGAGVYLISFRDHPIYLGKFQPLNRNSIFNDRWLRHIETITLRGTRVGFGPKSSLDKVIPTVCPELQEHLRDLPTLDKNYRFRDTGVCSSVNRRNFASINWEQFQTATAATILDHFDFRYYKISGIENGEQAKQVTSTIEGKLIRTFNLFINQAEGQRKPDSVNDIEKAIEESANGLGLKINLELHLRKVR
jgi:hypothetical protein